MFGRGDEAISLLKKRLLRHRHAKRGFLAMTTIDYAQYPYLHPNDRLDPDSCGNRDDLQLDGSLCLGEVSRQRIFFKKASDVSY